MKCCVKSCSSILKRNIPKSEGISFHLFPIDVNLYTAWINALGKKNITYPPNAVCSKHFLQTDLLVTKTGVKRIRNNALPVLEPETKPSTLLVCRICLGAEFKLLPIGKYNLDQTYKDVTGFNINKDDCLPQYMCAECAQKLLNCWKFINKCHKSRKLLLDSENDFSLDTLKAIDRKSNQLTSNLSMGNIVNIDADAENLVEIYVEDCKDDMFIPEFDGSDQEVTEEMSENIKKMKNKRNKPKIDRRKKPFFDDDNNMFTITDLSFEEQVAELQKRKLSANYRKSQFKCHDCFRGFLSEEAFIRHRQRHTNEYGDYVCAICNIHYINVRHLKCHRFRQHMQRFNCTMCPYVTTSRTSAKMHGRWHAGKKYPCQHCQEVFLQFTTYMSHVRIKHPSDFVCAWCGYCFISEKGIQQHKRMKHRFDDVKIPADGPMCEPCNIRFVSQDAYNKHLSVSARHSDTQQRNDPKRKNPVIRKRPPVGEMISCELIPADGPMCEPCNIRFVSQDAYNKHLSVSARHSENEQRNDPKRKNPVIRKRPPVGAMISCELCGVGLLGMNAYAQHFRFKHPGKVRTQYPNVAKMSRITCICEHCGKIFTKMASLKLHMWVHTGEKLFKCDYCSKSFTQKNSLEFHIYSIHCPNGIKRKRQRNRTRETVNSSQ